MCTFKGFVFRASAVLLLLGASACKSYEVVSVQSVDWPARSSEVNIGYFDASGSASRAANRNNLYESLSFSLREADFRTREAPDLFAILSRNELPVNRLLTEAEVLRLSGLVPGRILLQGRLEEVLTQTLVEDRVQVQVNVNIYSLETGRRLGEIRIYGRDLENVTGSETLAISRLVAKRLREMTGKQVRLEQDKGASPVALASAAAPGAPELDAEEEIQREMRSRYAAKRALTEAEMASRSSGPRFEGSSGFVAAVAPTPYVARAVTMVRISEISGPVLCRVAQVRGSASCVHYYSIRNGYCAGDFYA